MDYRRFIDKPVFSSVISIIIVVVGVISLLTLPVEQFPDIAPPTISVTTSYFGASAETVQKSVIAPLEEAINGVEDMNYIKSSATNSGTASIQVYFRQGTDPDMAAVNVQNRVSKAMSQLPAEVAQVGVSVNKRQSSTLQMFSVISPNSRYDENFISNYININIKPEILRLEGVGDIMVLGGSYSMRIWLKPEKMAQHSLNPSDISAILAEQNIEAATGTFGKDSDAAFQYTMKYKGRIFMPEEMGEIVIRANEDGTLLKLKDVAEIELGAESYAYHGYTNGAPGVLCMVYQTAGSNATAVNESIDALLAEMSENLPDGLEIVQLMSVNNFLFASVENVIHTLLEAILLVILVVYVFLQDFRSTVIPLIGIIVSLIGTFAFMALMGFSINMLTLFALVLVIGTVVDDAIIVVEAVQEKFDRGYKSSYWASVDAMKGVGGAVLTSSLVFMAVFIPVSFMGGTSGIFYKQFGLTMAAAVGISAINALSLSPALCALFLKPYQVEGTGEKKNFAAKVRKAYNASFNALLNKYKFIVVFFLRRKWLVWSLIAGCIMLFAWLMNNTKSSLVPEEDQGTIMMNVSASPGTTLSNTTDYMRIIEQRLGTIPQIKDYAMVSGYGLVSGQGSCFGMYVIKLKPWEERPEKSDNVNSVIAQIYGVTADIKEVSVFATSPGMIPGYGMGNSLDLQLQDKKGGSIEDFYNTAQAYIGQLSKRPEVSRAYSSFNIRYPQWLVEVDAAKCKKAGLSPRDLLSTVSAYYGGQYVSNINRFSRVYKVMMQSSPDYRIDESSLNNIYVRVNGQMAPLSQFLTLTRVYGAEVLDRFNLYNSISVSVSPAPGYSSGEVIKVVREVAKESLPTGYGFEFGGITREESEQNNTQMVAILAICALMIY
ncbi:MAG: efflux RND transporter permease subunit, partial [Bacteroidales bacterium]|nr:efflux RND transporter permease subunit [Bacteroidales bacterium]